ncbi:GntR family transcriptional regulator [Sphingobium sp. AP50]|uniref:GntR family transcriptional regulator n=1 Tax=Sphingobium sp. AP50 TaxID=1884369 RepID=UPI001160C308|nr:GntR family transcriptional regulator [Sphingobium sp. AP50]
MTETITTPGVRNRSRVPAPVLSPLDEHDGPLDRQVYQSLRKAIMSGSLLLGDRISSRSVGEALGVSQMPVREALKRLEGDGAVQSVAKSGYVIPPMQPDDYEELLLVRLELEGLVVRHAARHIRAEEIRIAQEAHDRLTRACSWPETLRQNFSFHFTIYRAARMPSALAMIENLWLRVGPALNMIESVPSKADTYIQHVRILEGLRRQDPVLVEAALREDIVENAEIVLRQLACSAS